MTNISLTYDEPAVAVPANSSIRPRDFLFVLVALSVSGLFIHYFEIEARLQLPLLVPFILIGFAVNAWLPVALRLPFFFLLNVSALMLLYGVITGTLITGLGLGLLGICHLRIPLKLRISLILIVAGLLASGLAGWIPLGEYKIVATVLGALFMFRMMVYLYEIQHEKEAVGPWKRISYFFLLPNLLFFIFPVVDYKTFVQNYYRQPAAHLYRKGLRWILRGLTHLFLYRLIYYYLVPAPAEVDSLTELLQYFVTSYLLILRLSGIFHFSVGVICLFGFDLPPVFHNYFLASGFSDLWRRINTYWRDFLMKVFYFPIYFRFKKRNTRAMVLTILILFAINWFLHSYQWFWIRGSFPLKSTDLIFWGLFGILVAISSVQQMKRKKPSGGPYTLLHGMRRSVRTLAMFAFMCTLYTFWISDTPNAWWQIVQQSLLLNTKELGWILSAVLLLLVVGGIWFWADRKFKISRDEIFTERELYLPLGVIAAFVLAASPVLRPALEQAAPFDLGPILETRLNRGDQERMYRGYYETIISGNDFTSNVPDLQRLQPENWDKLHSTGILITEEGSLRKSLVPDTTVIFKETRFSTNSLGLRDRDYTAIPAPGTVRMVLLGASIEMGSGVETGETYENLLEDQLNEKPLWKGKTEILNFGISGIHLPQQVYLIQTRVAEVKPDVVIYTAHPNEETRAGRQFARVFQSGEFREFPFLDSIYHRAELGAEMSYPEIQRKIQPFRSELTEWGLQRIAEECRKLGAVPVWVYIPSYGENPYYEENVSYARMARSLGFFTFDLNEVFKDRKPEEVTVRPWDRHPSELGHELLSLELYRQMEADTSFIEACSQ